MLFCCFYALYMAENAKNGILCHIWGCFSKKLQVYLYGHTQKKRLESFLCVQYMALKA